MVGALSYAIDINERKEMLREIIGVAQRMAAGDLSKQVSGTHHGDYLAIVDSFNQALMALSQAMTRVTEAADQVSSIC